jgi:hypothetical protein
LRYDWQNIFVDNNNVAPRASVSYAPFKQTRDRGLVLRPCGDAAIRAVLRSWQTLLQRATWNSPFFGQPSSAQPPRRVQLSASMTPNGGIEPNSQEAE